MGKTYKYLPLLTMYDAIETEKPYPIKALWIAAYNPMNQNPHRNKLIKELLPRIDFIVTTDLFMTASAEYSDIVLPACSFYECVELIPPFDSNNTFLQFQAEVIEPVHESKSHVDMVNAVGKRMGFEAHFDRSAEEYLELLLSSGHASMEGVTLEKLKKRPINLPDYEVPVFRTPSGRLEFYSEAMKPFGEELPVYKEPVESARQPLASKYPLSFITGHTRYLKCTMLANSRLIRDLDPQPMLEMHPGDAEKRGIRDGDTVLVFNDRGKVKLKTRIHQGVPPGLVNINQGWRPQDYKEGSHQELTHYILNPGQAAAFEPNAALFDILVEVKKEEG
jgi:molybdopterin-containing oxidoreductase family molybdopterin binding subunit